MKKLDMDLDLPTEEFIDPDSIKTIVSSKTFDGGNWKERTQLRGFPDGVTKWVIPVDISRFCMLVVTEVKPGTYVARHAHSEGIIRYILSGSLVLNDVEYGPGDWILAPDGVAYGITTTDGYTALAGYLMACGPPPVD